MRHKYEEIRQRGCYVEVRDNDVNRAMRKLKKLVQSEGILQTLREREHYTPPGQKRKVDRARAVRRWRKKLREMQAAGIAR